jgi:hypothetical protein
MRRMMLIDASWPSKSEAAVTKRTLLVSLNSVIFFDSDRSVMIVSGAVARALRFWLHRFVSNWFAQGSIVAVQRLTYVYVNVN